MSPESLVKFINLTALTKLRTTTFADGRNVLSILLSMIEWLSVSKVDIAGTVGPNSFRCR